MKELALLPRQREDGHERQQDDRHRENTGRPTTAWFETVANPLPGCGSPRCSRTERILGTTMPASRARRPTAIPAVMMLDEMPA
jgi:hypothetical protein